MGTRTRPHRKLAISLIVLASIVGLLSIFAIWVKRQALETDTWVNTSTKLLQDEDIQTAVSGFLVDSLYSSVDVEGQLSKRLPPQAQALAGPAAGALRELADRLALEALQRPKVQELWAEANRKAHLALLAIVENKSDTLSTAGGDVSLDLSTIVEQLGAQTGLNIAGKVPESASSIQILSSDELGAAQDGVRVLRALTYGLILAMLVLFALALYLAHGWRREALRTIGWSFVAVGILALAIRTIAGNALVGSLTDTAAAEPPVQSTWAIGTSLLRASAISTIGYGIVIVAGAWLAGPGGLARGARRGIAPVLHSRAVGYGVLAGLVLLLFWWNPTPGTSRLGPSIILILLLIVGFEALRRQTLRDFPDETWERMGERWRGRMANLGTRRRAAGDAAITTGAVDPQAERIAQLERLSSLRQSGVLDEAEFQAEKRRLLA
jgi:hypothetical protein